MGLTHGNIAACPDPPCLSRPSSKSIALSSATCSPRSAGSMISAIPAASTRTGSAAARRACRNRVGHDETARRSPRSTGHRFDDRRRRRRERVGPGGHKRAIRTASVRRAGSSSRRVSAKPPIVASCHGITVCDGGTPELRGDVSWRTVRAQRDERARAGGQCFRRGSEQRRRSIRSSRTPRSTSRGTTARHRRRRPRRGLQGRFSSSRPRRRPRP
jgi:hypothetical protein